MDIFVISQDVKSYILAMNLNQIRKLQNQLFFVLFVGLFSLVLSCQPQEDKVFESLDEIKAFKPDDKYFKSSLVSLHFLIETSSISEVDSFFRQMMKVYNLPTDAQGVPDGIYKGESPYDAFEFKHVVEIEVKDEKIVSVDYNEIHSTGWGKQENEEYCQEMSVSGTTPAIAYPLMEENLLQTQNMMGVDAVSGASYSLYRFRYAMAVALMKGLIENENGN
jgi:major membrane immunogen (membrane-anchored lipoprotein)